MCRVLEEIRFQFDFRRRLNFSIELYYLIYYVSLRGAVMNVWTMVKEVNKLDLEMRFETNILCPELEIDSVKIIKTTIHSCYASIAKRDVLVQLQ